MHIIYFVKQYTFLSAIRFLSQNTPAEWKRNNSESMIE